MALSTGPNLDLLVDGAPGDAHHTQLMRQWRGIDALVMANVIDKDLTAPPGSPSDGDCYIVAAGPTGAWSGHAKHIARWSDVAAAWEFYVPRAGWSVYAVDEDERYQYTSGGTWALVVNLASTDVLTYKGVIDCSANPNYPAADAGDTYLVSVAGKIGGASGPAVDVGDMLLCKTDGTSAGNHATVGAQWGIVEAGGAIRITAGSVTNENFAVFDGTTGRLIKEFTPTQVAAALQSVIKPLEHFVVACSDETTLLTTGVKVTFRTAYAFTLTDIKASVTEAATGGTLLTVDVKEAGASILSTLLTFDASEKTTVSATTPRVIGDSSLAADAEMTIEITAIGNTLAGKGLKVTFIGYRT